MTNKEQAPAQEAEPQAGMPPTVVAPPDFDHLISQKVADAVAAVIPQLFNQIAQAQAGQGGGPSQAVQVVQTAVVKPNHHGHYRKDGVTVGKHLEFDMEMVEAGVDPNEAVKKGSWIKFVNGHFYAETQNQARQLDWLIANDPYCGVYRDDGDAVIPCPVQGCVNFFSNEGSLRGHLAATHGMR